MSWLGRALAERLAELGAAVIPHGCDSGRLDAACEKIRAAVPGGRLHLVVADLSSLTEVDRLAEAVLAEQPALHALVNNASVGFGRRLPHGRARKAQPAGHRRSLVVLYKSL